MREIDVTARLRPRIAPLWLTPRLDAVATAIIAAGLMAYLIAAMGGSL